MRRLPSLNALRFFDSAARQLSFSLAAKELCVTHSAVSQQIRQLEQWFDCPLFERRAGGVQLTAAGLDLQRAAEDAFDLLERRCSGAAPSLPSWPWARRPVSCPTGSSPAGAFRGRASRHPHPPADRGGRPAEHPARRRADPAAIGRASGP